VQQLAGKDSIIADYREKQNTLDASIDSKVNAKTGNVNDMYGYGLLAFIGCVGFFVWKTRQPSGAGLVQNEAVTNEKIAEIRKLREERRKEG